MPWTVNARENIVLLNNNPMSAVEAATLAAQLHAAAKHVRAIEDRRRKAAEPPPLAPLDALEGESFVAPTAAT